MLNGRFTKISFEISKGYGTLNQIEYNKGNDEEEYILSEA
jgi:hypothetical protein